MRAEFLWAQTKKVTLRKKRYGSIRHVSANSQSHRFHTVKILATSLRQQLKVAGYEFLLFSYLQSICWYLMQESPSFEHQTTKKKSHGKKAAHKNPTPLCWCMKCQTTQIQFEASFSTENKQHTVKSRLQALGGLINGGLYSGGIKKNVSKWADKK